MSMWNAVSQQWFDLDKQFVEKPELWVYVFGNKPIPENSPDKEKATTIDNYVWNFIDNALIIGDYLKDIEITHLDEW